MTDGAVAVKEMVAAMNAAESGGIGARGRRLSWAEAADRITEFTLGLRAAGVPVGATFAIHGVASLDRMCAELGAVAAGCSAANGRVDVIVVDRIDAAAASPGAVIVALTDTPPAGVETLERFAARGLAWAASNPAPVLHGAIEASPLSVRAGERVIVHGDVPPAQRWSAIAATALAGGELSIVEGDLAAAAAALQPVAALAAGPALDRLAEAAVVHASRHQPGIWLVGRNRVGTRVMRLLARDVLGGRLRLVVGCGPAVTRQRELSRFGVRVVEH